MRYLLFVLVGGSTAFSVKNNHIAGRNTRALDTTAGGYDKHPRVNFETTNGTSPAPRTFGNVFTTRDECNNGIVDCSGYQCDDCGSCCGGGTCAENFGNCCGQDTHCSFGFSCCSSGCRYENTSFCCDSSPTGCCVKGTQCTSNGCVGEPAFLIESVTTTTTLTSVVYYTSTALLTSVSTNLSVTIKFVTRTVTRDNIDVATVTNYITSTKIAERFLPETSTRTEHSVERRSRPTPPAPPPTPTTARGLEAFRHGLENIGLLPKRDVTSYIVFVWDTYSSGIVETSTVASEINSTSTEFSTIVSTLFRDAKSTTTVVSTVIVTSTQATTSTTKSSIKDSSIEPVTTKTSNVIVVMTTFVVGVTNSGNNEVATATSIIDGGGASGLQVATGVSTATSRSDGPSSGPSTTPPTSSSIDVNGSSKQRDLSTGAKAGIGAGAGAAGLALLGAMVFFALGRRRRPTSTISGDNSQAPMAPSKVSNWTPPPPPPPLRYSHLDSREVLSYTERAAALARSMENMRPPASTPSTQGYQPSSNFSPASRGASPSTSSELMMGHGSPRDSRQEMGGTAENMRWYMGMRPHTAHHGIPDRQYHEMPSLPEPSHVQYPRQGRAW